MSLLERITSLEAEVAAAAATNADEVERFRVAYLGRNGSLTALFDAFKQVSSEEKKALGQRINQLKQAAQARLEELQLATAGQEARTIASSDGTRPAALDLPGSLHPITLVRRRIVDIFARIGFTVSEGPEVEDDHHNFGALNFPPEHPARDMQDTFFVEGPGGLALRTHTSSVQVRVMEGQKPPIRTVSPGRVYRNEAISARAHCMFHQVEGLYVDKDVNFAELKGTLDHFAKSLFGPEVRIRMRPSYFPFTEPSAEVDMSCSICDGAGCAVCKHSGWVEIMGCGMVDPAVLSNCGIDPTEYSGFAFGMGVERIAQLVYRIPDLRLYWENDVRFLEQFSGEAFRS
ncbi:MAG: phenylalanine--tRNA ligase subunit alpha [Flavobacteriales bacterium]|jgi:phenylalanyl-tRNA synthetase alpha chain|nr:phenylalanine--tRNA ligase subunit alpha [Flavobacteriales bacterium]MBK7268191.1 phenylalanine--tRNA ligase subunit alpha [Flavobacteriales bacterium]MBK7751153.1 phenylalanine--tRNA ligase subunit alpha [Flavobacteriales bacterium]MBK9073494.1 phenylalanine--tRNA ligase subunit alpha [Flavobacteriales bacterium]MBK9539179.1 phenylalanine--tRNA ligase subunit alpha [Flavobacteriales bacterium]